ncbi:Kinase binding protein [Paramyrothecium foliicola]|nr:Kinase binding protein [Paramyrothecium foliicola]
MGRLLHGRRRRRGARTNVSAFWTQTWWRILFGAPKEAVLAAVTARTPQDLLNKRAVRRHQAVVDAATGDVVGGSSPRGTAQTPDVDETEKKRLKEAFDGTALPLGEKQTEMDALDVPINEARERLSPTKPFISSLPPHSFLAHGAGRPTLQQGVLTTDFAALDYLATHPDRQKRGVSSTLANAGIEQADKLGLEMFVLAKGYASTNLYKKHGFELLWELSQSLKQWGHEDVCYTAILIKQPVKNTLIFTPLSARLPRHPQTAFDNHRNDTPANHNQTCRGPRQPPMPSFEQDSSPNKKRRLDQSTATMSLESVTLEHLPASHGIHLALFKDVKNAAFLHQQLLARNADFEYAFVDASVVLSRRQLLSAVFKATTSLVNDALKTPNVHSEIVTSLSPSNNIADAYRRFGVSPTTKDLLVVKVTFPTETQPRPASADQVWKHLEESVEGSAVPVTDEQIAATADVAKVRKYYKLNGLNWLDDIKDEAAKRQEMETLVLGGMALRGFKCCLESLLGQSDGRLAPANQLSPHGIAATSRALHGILVLLCATQQVLHALSGGAPSQVLVDWQQPDVSKRGLASLAGLNQLAADLVSHALKLGAGDIRLALASLADGAGAAHRVGVVGSQEQVGRGVLAGAGNVGTPLAGEHAGGHGVVALVGVGLCVVKAVAGIGVEVGAADELDTEGEALLLGQGEVVGEDLGGALLVGLVGGIDGGHAGVGVVLAGKGHAPVVDAVLEAVLLGVDAKTNTAFMGELADGVDGLAEHGGGRETFSQPVKGHASGTGEPEKKAVIAGLGHLDGLKHTLSPGLDLGLDVLGSLLNRVAGVQRLDLGLGEDDLPGVGKDDAVEADVLEAVDGGADLGAVLAGAELGVKGLLEQVAQEGVAVRIEDGVGGVGEQAHDAQRGGQQQRRGGDDGGGERAEDHAQREDGQRRAGAGLHGRRGIRDGQAGDGGGSLIGGVDVPPLLKRGG